ncbi:enoyl-CoA hydratase/isomerase [Paenibacillus sp. ACRRX]|uniref:enoyl-CoA hydratase/isomerase n=1 Tax=Paenibacillus sp. ACRRX TaxID=2918206 RepID=UPI001EF6CDE3|nr:enoyl-CoA hydratase/isomerase [Paenibacillus sp. ACRRX]MCG7409125.1 enoyl-CoA hydratase/isomerase [Paenibacillus sp. ACRRX]
MSSLYETIRIRHQGPVAYIQLYRPDADNSINDLMIFECSDALVNCGDHTQVIVLEGLPDVFCSGADFQHVSEHDAAGSEALDVAAPLYALWEQLANGPYVTIAHVKGKVNAGGVGFAAACDMVIAEDSAQFSLSEMLFGLFPACVLPFLIRRIGYQRSHYLTLSTQAISGSQAYEWGLADAVGPDSELLLRKHIPRLTRISREGIVNYKLYMSKLRDDISAAKPEAIRANQTMFADPSTRERISRYAATGLFPWES